MSSPHYVEAFTAAERAVLQRHVTNLEGPVFALRDLPQVTCAALFARYSRTAKSLRRLLLDEFLPGEPGSGPSNGSGLGRERAAGLFGRVLTEYGDDSVAQLAGVHLACEQASIPLAKLIEWGRFGSYLEQSTRYVRFNDRPGGHYRYVRDPEVLESVHGPAYLAAMDGLFETYSALIEPLERHLEHSLPPQDDNGARRRAIRALALDHARGILPAGTARNVGVFASPQAYEQLVMRLRAHPLPEARRYAELINRELQAVIPEFLTRLDRPERGGVWTEYLTKTASALGEAASTLLAAPASTPAGVRLLDWDPGAEDKVIAAALFPHAAVPEEQIRDTVRGLPAERRAELFQAAVGDRRNRRHRPGRCFERADYTFEVVSDYGAAQDLQRHRALTFQWQGLTPGLGYEVPVAVEEAGLAAAWRTAVESAERAHQQLLPELPGQAAYLVTLNHRVRYSVHLNAREAMHMIELRTSPQGHPSYRQICQEMHRLISEVAGHRLIAGAMRFVHSDDVHLPRYAAEVASG